MAENAAGGTNVGAVYIDLIVRDTTAEQIQKITSKAQQTAQKNFTGVERSAERMVSNVTAQTEKAAQKASEAVAQASAPIASTFNRPVALAQAKLNQLERTALELSQKLEGEIRKDFSFKVYGYVADDNKVVANLQKQLDAVHSKIEAADERLAIEKEAAAQKSAAAAQRATEKQERAAQRMAEKAAAATERAAVRREKAEQKAAAAAERAAQKAAAAEEKAANRRKAVHAAMWKNMLSKAGAGAKSILGKLSGVGKGYDGVGKSARRFTSRLREITSGALLFNGISAALRSVINYFSKTIASTDQMQTALANLKGAAANAASPIIQVLTPALTALANAAATVFSYVARLLTMLTGKISTAASTASKSAGAAKKAMASLAGFDEIQRLDSNDSGSGGSETQTPNYDFQGKSPFLDELLAAIQAGQWEQVGKLLAKKLNDSLAAINWEKIQSKATQWTRNLVDTINGFVHELDFGLIGNTIGNGLNTIGLIIDTFFQKTDWVALGQGFGTGLNGLFDTVDWALLGRVLTDKLKALAEIFHGFVHTFDFKALGNDLAEMVTAGIGNINWVQLTTDLFAGLSGLMDLCSGFIQGIDWGQLGSDLWNGLIGVVTGINWTGLVASAFELLGSCLGGSAALYEGICTAIQESLEAAWDNTVSYFNTFIEDAGGNIIQGLWNGILAALANAGQWIIDNIFTPFIDGFCEAFGIHSPSTVMEEKGGFIIAGLLKGLTIAWTDIVRFFEEKLSGISDSVSRTWENVKTWTAEKWSVVKTSIGNTWDNITSKSEEASSQVEQKVVSAFNRVKDSVTEIWENGIVPIFRNAVNGIISIINGMVSGVVSGINTMIRALNRIHFDIPDWVPAMGGKSFGFNLGELSAPQIPMLAGGGVIKQPTLAMMGEYSGAQSNPEIVAPQSIIEETVASVLGGLTDITAKGFAEVVTLLKDILEAVLGIEIDGETLSRAIENYRRKMAVVKGGT